MTQTMQSRSAGLQCVRCGYDLRGHASAVGQTDAAERRCPECGERVAISETYADPRRWPGAWMMKQRMGTTLLLVSYAVSGLTMMGEMRLGVNVLGYGLPAVRGLQMLTLLMLGLGSWLVTSRPSLDPRGRSVVWVRWLCVVFVFVGLLNVLGVPSERLGAVWSRDATSREGFSLLGPGLWAIVQSMFLVSMVLGWMGLLCVQAGVARRLGDRVAYRASWAALGLWGMALATASSYYLWYALTGGVLFVRSSPMFLAVVGAGSVALLVSILAQMRAVWCVRSGDEGLA